MVEKREGNNSVWGSVLLYSLLVSRIKYQNKRNTRYKTPEHALKKTKLTAKKKKKVLEKE